jgi:hypothetical protein
MKCSQRHPGDFFLMNRLTNIVCLLVVAGSASAQSQPSKPDSDRPQLVEVVGCLSQTGANWVLTNASDPAASTTSFTTPEAVKAAAEKPLGTEQIRLLGIAPFSPDGHKGHKMVVRGLLIKSAGDTRLNLTSFQMVSETCVK